MTEPVAYLNGSFVPITEAKLSVFDLGLVQGASVTEMIRTFAHQPFRLEEHLRRLMKSLRVVGFDVLQSEQELLDISRQVTARNAQLIPAGHDLGVVLFVTAGENLTYVGAMGAERARQPSVCVHTFPLPFELWVKKYETGQHLVIPSIRHMQPETLDPKIKSRSRLHWHLADRQARLMDPHAGSLLLDRDDNITETSSGNFCVVQQREILTPSPRNALQGVSLAVVQELAERLGLAFRTADLQTYDALTADEAFTTSTPYCLLPVTRLNGTPIGSGQPGPVFQQLLNAWNDLCGLDIMAQMRQGAAERLARML